MTDAQLAQEIKEQETKCQVAYQKATRVALPSYGIVPVDDRGYPVMPTGASAFPGYDNRLATWVPVYTQAFREKDRSQLLLNGKNVHDPITEPGAVASTSPDGVTIIFGRFRTAAEYATMLYHERIHYDQLTTKGRGDVLTASQREMEAYRIGLNDLEDFGFDKATEDQLRASLKTSQIKYQLRDAQEKKESRSVSEKLKRFLYGDKLRTPVSQYVVPHSPDELVKIRDEAEAFERKVRKDTADRRLASLKALARRACANPSSVTQQELMTMKLPSGEELPRPNILASFDCVDKLYYDLIQFLLQGREPSAERIQEMARANLPMDTSDIILVPPGVVIPDATLPDDPPTPVLTIPTVRDNLFSLAWAACEQSPELTRESIKDYLRGFPDGNGYGFENAKAGCAKDLVSILMDKNVNSRPGDTIDYDWLIQTAAGIKSPGGGSNGGQGQHSGPNRGSPPGSGPPLRPPDFRGR